MAEEKRCPECGGPLAADAPQGLCPACLLKRGLAAGSSVDASPQGARTEYVPPTPDELARYFPELEILELIGRGGMGAVYKARQKRLDRFVALKVLPVSVSRDPAFAERFAREAKALARLTHPNIVAVHDFGQTDGLFYFVMEFVDGLNLRQLLNTGQISPKEALAIVPQICEALQYAHDKGIVHRDIKPENILLAKDGTVKIADFGLAKLVGLEPKDLTITGKGDVMGTPHYMAPEQVEHPQDVDHRADIYSLGVVFYQMLTGELPIGRFAAPSKKVTIDVRLDEVVLRALEKEPERRYQQASVLKTEVETIVTTPPVSAEGLAGDVLARDYRLDIGSCLGRGWALVQGDFWRIVGITALIWVLMHAAKSTLVGIVLEGPLIGGLQLYFLRKIRGQQAVLQTAFSGFSTAFAQLFLVYLVTTVLTVVGFVCLVLPGVYLLVAWTFAATLVIDKRIDFWPAMGLSRRAISKHWWKFFWFGIVLGLVQLAGILVFCVGFLVAVPVAWAATMYAYEDIFGPAARAVVKPMNGSPAPAVAPTLGRRHSGWGVAIGTVAVILTVGGVLLAAHHFYPVKSDYIGQAYFPGGDWIEITSVSRSEARLTVKGHYNLVSTDKALLALYCTSTNGANFPEDPTQRMQISKGRADFELSRSHLYPGLHHVTMYSADGKPFAGVYFGTKREARREARLDLSDYQVPGGTPAAPSESQNGHDKSSLVGSKTGLGAEGEINSVANSQAELPAQQETQGTLGEPYRYRSPIIGRLLAKDEVCQDFNQILPLRPGGSLSLDDVSGRIRIAGWNRDEVVIKAVKRGKTRESVEATGIEIDAGTDHVAVHTKRPTGWPWSWFWWNRGDVDVDYTIQVPQRTQLEKISSVSGEIGIEGVSGDIKASTVSGEIQIKGATGNLKLSTVNGAIAAELGLLGGAQSVSLDTVNGEIVATLPDGADAEVSARTVNGAITSEFASLSMKKGFPMGGSLEGTLGSGGASVSANAVNGSISIRRGRDALKSGAKQTEEEEAGRSVAGLPPVVVCTQPVSGARDVEPGLAEIRATFSKEMTDRSWSWCYAWKDSIPEMIGEPRYEADHRTCALKVKLEPGRTYAFWLNTGQVQDFTDQAGRPAVPYLLIFQTKQ
ncbi:MAG TPA: protein kinase [Verrucomicrobiae bacterium]|nr:protein kinase [Verrucomicrobiae bacterium]